ncbi:MAG: hypothetical protein OXU31_02410 [Gammaproteobacteria bacterium]|nr:hypothetical protein [Gammaproteobacteria bacterium]
MPRTHPRLGGLSGRYRDALESAAAGRWAARLWSGDASLWPGDGGAIKNRLGWLEMEPLWRDGLAGLRDFAAAMRKTAAHCVWLGMGGSSVAAQVFAGEGDGRLDLRVVDTTRPEAVAAVREEVDWSRALVVAAGKSGATLETDCLLRFFAAQKPAALAAITDAGSALHKTALASNFARIFLNPSAVGGRFAPLTWMGLLPAALLGMDVDKLLAEARTAMNECRADGVRRRNPGLELGVALGVCAQNGCDKLIVERAPPLQKLFPYIAQLVAESTGKDGKGLLPLLEDGPALTAAGCCAVRNGAPGGKNAMPAVWREGGGGGGELFTWQFAVAVAGAVMKINPFNEPDVARSKILTGEMLGQGAPREADSPGQLAAFTAAAGEDRYLALLNFLPPDDALQKFAGGLRRRAARHGCRFTVCDGPRYLHSTGQLHKGGGAGGAFIVLSGEPAADVAVPDAGFTFGDVNRAQAFADARALRERGRRVLHLHLNTPGEMHALAALAEK